MSEPTLDQVNAALLAWAEGDPGRVAAVQVLIHQGHWIPVLLKEGLIDYEDRPTHLSPDSPPLASIYWQEAANRPWTASGGEMRMLMAACSLASPNVKVSLRDVTCVDTRNRELIVKGLLRAGGQTDVVWD